MRTRLVREVLRVYCASRAPAVEATSAELEAIRRGREDIAAGDYVTLDQLHESLATPDSETRRT